MRVNAFKVSRVGSRKTHQALGPARRPPRTPRRIDMNVSFFRERGGNLVPSVAKSVSEIFSVALIAATSLIAHVAI
jgi:hypothetical protein